MRGLALWAALGLAATARAGAPDWALEAAREPVPPSTEIAMVVNHIRVTYVDLDRTRRLIQCAYKLNAVEARGRARWSLPYNADITHILSARAWIISPDGIRAKAYRRADFIDVTPASDLYWNAQRILVFDGSTRMEAGDVLACEAEIEVPTVVETGASFAPDMFCARTALEVLPPPGATLVWHNSGPGLPAPAPFGASGGLHWEQGPIRSESAGRPTGFLRNPQWIGVRAEPPGESASWAGLARLASSVMNPRIEESAEIRAMASQVVGGQPTRWARIRALTQFVQKEVIYFQITLDQDNLAGYRPHPATETLGHRYGDCKDKAVLLVALLRAAGEDGRILLLNWGAPTAIDPTWPALQFNHAIALIRDDAGAPPDWPRVDGGALGRLVVFDPTDPDTPLGVLSGADQGGWGLLVDPAQGGLVRLPKAEGPFHHTVRGFDATLDAQGTLHATASIEQTGLDAAQGFVRRQAVPPGELDRFFARLVQPASPSVRCEAWTDTWIPTETTYRQHLQFRAEEFGRRITDQLVALKPQLLPGLPALSPWKTAAEGVAWLPTADIRDRVRIQLPPGDRAEELPDDWVQRGATVTCRLHYAMEAGALVYESEFTLRPGFYDRPHYEAIRRFLLRVDAAESRPVLLRRPAVTPAAGAGP